MRKTGFIYDANLNSLVIFREDRRNYASVKLGEVIVNFDKNMNISAVEILNPDLLFRIPKKRISKIEDAAIQGQQRGPVFWLYVLLKFEDSEIPQEFPIQIPVNQPVSI